MKKYLIGFWYSLPIQLFLMHFRKYQVFLLFWYILFATVAGNFMHNFGADSLFLAPEYLNEVNAISFAFVGVAVGVFVMSWNITSFILLGRHVRFLATTAQPFLKYCINNAIIPLLFVGYYLYRAVQYDVKREFMDTASILLLIGAFALGFIVAVTLGFVYFFGADKTIYKEMGHTINFANKTHDLVAKTTTLPKERRAMRVDWFLSARFQFRKPRETRHYTDEFLNAVFKRHHFAAVIAIFIAFITLIGLGFLADERLFQIPAAASITVFFAVLIAVAGAFSVFLKTWSIPIVVLLYVGMNYLYKENIIDFRNKAYGLNYTNKKERPAYTRENILSLATKENMEADKRLFLKRLEAWKANQQEEKPVLYIINTSGGGSRSAAFTFNVLQQLDAQLNGELMKKTLFISGASGGMLGAAYFRELYLQKLQGKAINLQDKSYVDNVSKDLLNPLFSSFVTRDLLGPVQKFSAGGYHYVKDRGYAFEQKLNANTKGVLNKSLQEYALPEKQGIIPTMFFNNVISRDGRKMIICTQPVRFLMRPLIDSSTLTMPDPDAVDFLSFFQQQNPSNLRVLTALRMNATFPYVLPNVWLPTNPVIDVMDAGIRDNFGQENTLRFIDVFKEWMQENTSKVVIIQIRDRSMGDWDKPYLSNNLLSVFTRPAFLLQNNWYKLQDYYQQDQLAYLSHTYGTKFHRICFQYIAKRKEETASLSFHLTSREKKEIAESLGNEMNVKAFEELKK